MPTTKIYTVLTFILFVSLIFGEENNGPSSISYDKDTFLHQITEKNHFVMFYAPWCGHCKRLKPMWDQLHEGFIHNEQVTIAKVDCTQQIELCSEQGVTGYPTLKFFKLGVSEGVRYKSSRDLESLQRFVHDQLGSFQEEPELEADQPVDDVITLTDATFAKHIELGRHFVEFYAPWCPHCQSLAEPWNQLAAKYRSIPNLSIAKVDCTQNDVTCSQNDIGGYPTLLWFVDGAMVEKYSGNRDLESLQKFVDLMKDWVDEDKGTTQERIPSPEEIKEGPLVLTTATFPQMVSQGSVFIKFYAPWCSHCQRMAADWDSLAAKFKDTDHMTVAKVDCTQNSELCQENGVQGYPTLLWFKDGVKVDDYKGQRDVESLSSFVREKLDITNEKQETVEEEKLEHVRQLTVETFDSFIAQTDPVFVKFFAPWCGHCKALAPTWDDLGTKFKDTNIRIAKVDCTTDKELCSKHEVRGYPTLKLFQSGVFKDDYKGARDLESLSHWVRSQEKRDEL